MIKLNKLWDGQNTTSAATSSDENEWDFTGYTDWEREVIINLANSGQTGYDMAQFIMLNGVHITFEEMIKGNGAQWKNINGKLHIALNADTFSEKTPTTSHALIIRIAEEAKHLQQGPKVALSVYGEQEAWRVRIRVNMDLGGKPSNWERRLYDLPLNHNPFNLYRADFYMQMEGGIFYPIWILQLYPSPIGLAYIFNRAFPK